MEHEHEHEQEPEPNPLCYDICRSKANMIAGLPIEIFFCKMTRPFLYFARVSSQTELKQRAERYLDEVNVVPVVFRWKYKMDEVRV